jgi:hypothetical protein
MTFFSRMSRTVTPLSTGAESLLRGMPRVTPLDPTRAKISLLAAFERGQPREGSAIFRALRIAVPAGAVAAGVVLGLGVVRGPRIGDMSMVARGDVVARSGDLAMTRLRVVDRAQLPILRLPGLGDGPDAP